MIFSILRKEVLNGCRWMDFTKFDIWIFFLLLMNNCRENSSFIKLYNNKTSQQALSTFIVISRQTLLTTRNASPKFCSRNQNTYFLNKYFAENRAVYEIKCETYGKSGHATDSSTVRRIVYACWITKATKSHSHYVILTAFLRQYLLHPLLNVTLNTHWLCCS